MDRELAVDGLDDDGREGGLDFGRELVLREDLDDTLLGIVGANLSTT